MIYIDKREERSQIPVLLKGLDAPTELKTLPVGDYNIDDKLPIERKAIGDYLSSLVEGHLSKQLYELSYNSLLSYLIVEGLVSSALIDMKISRHVYLSSLVGSSLKTAPDGARGRVITLNVESPYDTALVIYYLHQKIQEGNLNRLPVIERASFSGADRALYVIQSLPGVGEIKANALFNRFGSLKAVFNATKTGLEEVEGIGPKLSEKLISLFEAKEGDL